MAVSEPNSAAPLAAVTNEVRLENCKPAINSR